MKVPDLVTGDDELEKVGQCAAMHGGIAGESGKDFSGFEVPQLHRVVPGCRDRTLPVLGHRRQARTGVSGEGAQLAPAAQLPHLQRVVIRRRDRALPVGRHRRCRD